MNNLIVNASFPTNVELLRLPEDLVGYSADRTNGCYSNTSLHDCLSVLYWYYYEAKITIY